MYKARNGFTLKSSETAQGWTIKSANDIMTALLAFPYFQTVATGILWEALDQATTERKEYEDIKDLAEYLAEYYI